MPNPQAIKTKLKEVQLASQIHGGMLKLCIATLGVKLARVRIPSRRLRLKLYRAVYGKKYHALDESELEQPLWAYPSINALFTRGIRPELRPIADPSNQFCVRATPGCRKLAPLRMTS